MSVTTDATIAGINRFNTENYAMAQVLGGQGMFSADLRSTMADFDKRLEETLSGFEGALAQGQETKPYPVSMDDLIKPVTKFYDTQRARLEDTVERNMAASLERVEAAAEGSGDKRPWAKTTAINAAMGAITAAYSDEMRKIADTQMRMEVGTMLQWAGQAADFDVKQTANRNQLIGTLLSAQANLMQTAASYTATMAGHEAQVYAAEKAAAAQIGAAMIGAASRVETAILQVESQERMQETAQEHWYQQQDYLDAQWYEQSDYAQDVWWDQVMYSEARQADYMDWYEGELGDWDQAWTRYEQDNNRLVDQLVGEIEALEQSFASFTRNP